MNCKQLVEKVTRYSLQIGFYLVGLNSVPSVPWLTTIIRFFWLGWLFYMGRQTFTWFINSTIGAIVGTALFQSNLLSTIVTTLEAMTKQSQYAKIHRLKEEVDTLITKKLHLRVQNTSILLRLTVPVTVLYACEVFQIWISINLYSAPMFWHTFVMVQCLRLRYLQFISIVMELHQRVGPIKEAMSQLAAHNKPKSKFGFDIWLPYTSWEYEQLNTLRLIHGRLHEAYMNVDETFGWSILSIFLTTFFVFVCNIFWCIEMLYTGFVLSQFMYNAATMTKLGILVCMVFWYGDVSENNSRYIGGNAFKLVKPLGNKCYSDLLTNFSLQTLHQQYFLTAKGFFKLNLNFLGGMIAAIVTYLVILIQFMFVEKFSTGKPLATLIPLNCTEVM